MVRLMLQVLPEQQAEDITVTNLCPPTNGQSHILMSSHPYRRATSYAFPVYNTQFGDFMRNTYKPVAIKE